VIVLRPASAPDLPAMATVFIAAWRGAYRGVVPDEVIDALDHAELVGELAANPYARTTTVAVDEAGLVVGWARYGTDSADDGGGTDGTDGTGEAVAGGAGEAGHLASLYVHPSTAGAGVGSRLLHHALDAMPDREVTLWVFAGNRRARRFYERAGFVADGAELTDPRWRTPQVRYRRPACPLTLPPLVE
jgi:ribosomal protein S18 acetylase RimI-like enzyme